MSKELELWQFIEAQLRGAERVMLLVVADSSGSSPGRAGYKMAVGKNGELCGSIGGGSMEVKLVERAKALLTEREAEATVFPFTEIIDQVHRRDSNNSSGMICSGRQTVILRELAPSDLTTVERIIESFFENWGYLLIVDYTFFSAAPNFCGTGRLEPGGYEPISFRRDEDGFTYSEELNQSEQLYIIGGGHCALALSELAAKLNFRISIFDDRPELNTIAKNEFADEVVIIDNYEEIGRHIESGERTYVAVMTLGYASDAVVIRKLIDHDFKYFGVLGSRAKMATLFKELRAEGVSGERLSLIRTPIGLSINSQTPEEIAVSIAAEIISFKNA
ncbi:MAG TPA: XdhC family protein [Pyrinomonadaceae bacterium]|nr:XdhC family protein [Acidobacteriota bacterium]HQZ95853.1 XdhC family protein [Pyrinomonadaceae bacterium]